MTYHSEADMSIFLFMEDFDNQELSDYDRQAQLEEAVLDYNEQYGTHHDPVKLFRQYEAQRLKPNE